MVLHRQRVVAGVMWTVLMTSWLWAVEVGVRGMVGTGTDRGTAGTGTDVISEVIDKAIEVLGGSGSGTAAAILTTANASASAAAGAAAPTVFFIHRLRSDHGVAT